MDGERSAFSLRIRQRPGAIALLAPDGEVLELNAAALRLLGTPIDARGSRFWELPWWSETAAEPRLRLRDNVARCAAGEVIRVRAELGKPDARVVVDFSLRPVVSGGRVTSLVAEGRDITALVQD
ncbi:MAG: PAS domain-containing protein [Gammaproteobacteria bacterium]|nr:PAS domain-containing protein [Gammaproteobacteria bacterium]